MQEKGKHLRRAIAVSALSLVLCMGALTGATFAWFTDTITNTGNVIVAGDLSITATVAEVDTAAEAPQYTVENEEESYSVAFGESKDIETLEGGIIKESNWEPGSKNAKLLEVTNNGSLNAAVKVDFVTEDGGLAGALWFDFVQVQDGAVTGTFMRREMSTLETFAQALEFELAPEESLRFILLYGMQESAGNEYKSTSFTADVYILARQTNEDAVYDEPVSKVSSAEELKEKICNDATIRMEDDLVGLTDRVSFAGVSNTRLDMNGKELRAQPGIFTAVVMENSQNIEIANGIMTASEHCAFAVQEASASLKNMTLVSELFNDSVVKVFKEGTLSMEGCDVQATNIGGVWAFQTAEVNITDTKIVQKGLEGGFASWLYSAASVSNLSEMNLYGNNYFEAEGQCLYIFNTGNAINVYDGTYIGARSVLQADKGMISVYGGSFDGAIKISSNAALYIEAGTFANSGLTLEEFRTYVALGSTVTEENGAYIVTKN